MGIEGAVLQFRDRRGGVRGLADMDDPMTDDYTNVQEGELPDLPTPKSPEYRVEASRVGQELYQTTYGPRLKHVHVNVSTVEDAGTHAPVPGPAWFISPEMLTYVRQYTLNIMVFVLVTETPRLLTPEFRGWLYHFEVLKLMYPALNGSFDIQGPFRSMERYTGEFRG